MRRRGRRQRRHVVHHVVALRFRRLVIRQWRHFDDGGVRVSSLDEVDSGGGSLVSGGNGGGVFFELRWRRRH